MSAHPAQLPREELLKSCRVTRQRRGGPGGQHRNKVETAVVIEHVPTGVRAEANERRSQQQNYTVAVRRLRMQLALVVRSADARVFTPTELWRSRIRGQRVFVNASHDDFPALLAEALNMIWTLDYELRPAANMLGISGSQMVKFLKLEPAALEMLNERRKSQGKHAYR